MELKPLKVHEVNQYIKRILGSDPILYNVRIEGEISNFKHHYSGHMYFTLKDDKSRIKCVMFDSHCQNLNMKPKDGIHVIASGYVSVYERDGNYQLYVKEMKTKGIGELYIAFEALKEKLEKEGLFHEEHKKRLPLFPKKIGIVTSSTGAAIRDIITVIKRRLPTVTLLIYPVLVQGERAHHEICQGLDYFNKRKDIDVVIIGRGGGSIEELWAFNEEDVARSIFNMNIPVISAVGHETDFTIADFVADLRAPTPSAAGELAVPEGYEINHRLVAIYNDMIGIFKDCLEKKKQRLDTQKTKLIYNNPVEKTKQEKQHLDVLFKDLCSGFLRKREGLNNRLDKLGGKLNTLSPLSVLSRGYTFTSNENGHVVTSIAEVALGDNLKIRFKDGEVLTRVIKKDKGSE